MITAQSCSQAHVQMAITAAVSGDTVRIPAGNCKWDVGVTVNKAITVAGAGKTSTVLTANTTGTNIFTLSASARITGIGFFCQGQKTEADVNVNSVKGFRIDNCDFTHTVGGYGIIPDRSSGSIDSNNFVDSRIYVSYGQSSIASQQAAWAAPMEFGTDNAVYIENNSFTRNATGNVIDANRGAKFVYRFNTGLHAEVMTHGINTSNRERGTRSFEIYNNSFNSTGAVGGITPMYLRSGEGIIFNNTITGTWTWTNTLLLSSDRSLSEYNTLCNGSSPMDGNQAGQSGYICRDQVGAGRDVALTTFTGTWPDYVMTWQKQASSPVYLWGNSTAAFAFSAATVHIKENRDFYDAHPWGLQTSPTSPFNGTTGVGQGTMANRPASCTVGVGYWGTDCPDSNWNTTSGSGNDGCFYKCSSTNSWTRFYTPYTYPHPLRSGSVPSPSCTPNWTCTAWSTCTNSSQSRTCTDSSNCGVNTGKPATTQSCTSSKTADLNGDRKVDIFDYTIFAQNFGKTGSNIADLNSDSKVDIFDYTIFIGEFGK